MTTEITIRHFPQAAPLAETGVEMASLSPKIVIALSGTFRVSGTMRTAFIVGSTLSPTPVTYFGTPDCLEVSIKPWAVTPFLGVSAAELVGTVVDLSELPDTDLRKMLLSAEMNPPRAIGDVFQNLVEGHRSADARLTRAVWVALQREPTKRIADIAFALGVGTRRIRRALRQETGMSSGEIRRLMRQEKAVSGLAKPQTTLTQVTYDAGYADQSHMTRELVALTGMTPLRLQGALSSVTARTQKVPFHSRHQAIDL